MAMNDDLKPVQEVQEVQERRSGRVWRLAGCGLAAVLSAAVAMGDGSYHNLADGVLSQGWTDAGIITANDDWSGVPSVIGYRGDGLVSAAGIDPQTVLADGTATPVDVNANRSEPNTYTTGGITEFDGIAKPTVALQGSTTARAPFLLIHLCSTGMMQVRVQYDLRDVDGSADNAVQPFALHYRIGATGDFANVPAAFVADASSGPNLATNVTHIDAVLPAEADDRSELQVRIITTDAAGSDEWIGVDNIRVSASPLTVASATAPDADGNCSIVCPTRTGWTYQLQRSTNLLAWADAGLPVEGDGATHQFRDPSPGDRAFWRIEVR